MKAVSVRFLHCGVTLFLFTIHLLGGGGDNLRLWNYLVSPYVFPTDFNHWIISAKIITAVV